VAWRAATFGAFGILDGRARRVFLRTAKTLISKKHGVVE
jgi:hypothetical protein